MRPTTKTRIALSIARSGREVFLRGDFDRFGSPSRVTRAVESLIQEGKLVRLGYGIYSKATLSVLTNNPIPRKTLESLTPEIFNALNIPISMGKARREYASGKSNQVPMALVVSTGEKRINRKISVGGREIIYEKNLQPAG